MLHAGAVSQRRILEQVLIQRELLFVAPEHILVVSDSFVPAERVLLATNAKDLHETPVKSKHQRHDLLEHKHQQKQNRQSKGVVFLYSHALEHKLVELKFKGASDSS